MPYTRGFPPESAAQKIPFEIWDTILRAASASSLFPYINAIDPNSRVLSPSIIDNIHLFGQPVCQQVALYTLYLSRITQLRSVCRTWNDILSEISIYHRWMITDLQFCNYPFFNSAHQPDRLVVDIDDTHSKTICTNPSCRINLKVRKEENKAVSLFKWPTSIWGGQKPLEKDSLASASPARNRKREVYLSPSALSQVTILELGLTRQRDLFGMMGFVLTLRALSFDILSIYYPFRPLVEMDLGRHALQTLTHLRLYHMCPMVLRVCYATTLHFPNLVYFAMSFKSGLDAYSDPYSLSYPPSSGISFPMDAIWFQKWTLPKLESLCLEGEMPLSFAERLKPFFINCGQTVSQLLLDLDWEWKQSSLQEANTLLDNIWQWFPHINTLGCTPEAAKEILTREVSSVPSAKGFSLFPNAHSATSTLFLLIKSHESVQKSQNTTDLELLLTELFGSFKNSRFSKIYLSTSKDDPTTNPTPGSSVPLDDILLKRVAIIVDLCVQQNIRVFDRDGWEYGSDIVQ
ncbi:hypothetical protein CPB86DRAFT_783552 [Serendipita vermifera]|nr:hypothetical protein CPB86DRAFT_783552 [Serendipita vermifera]